MIARTLLVASFAVLIAGPAHAEEAESAARQLLIMWFPLLLFVGLWIYFMRKMGAGKQRTLIERYPAHMEALERKIDRIIELLEERSRR